MSTSTSRKLPADILAHPEVLALVESGKAAGQVTSEAVRDTSEAASVSGKHLKALLRHLSDEGVTVVLSAGESASGRVAAAASGRTTVKASTAKKAPAKKAAAKKSDAEPEKAPAKKAAAKKSAAKKSAETETEAPAAKKAGAAKSPAKKATKKAAGTTEIPAVNGVIPPAVVGPDGK